MQWEDLTNKGYTRKELLDEKQPGILEHKDVPELPMIHIVFTDNGLFYTSSYSLDKAMEKAKSTEGTVVSLGIAQDFRSLSKDNAA
jgi:hypothetical protein